MAVDVNQWRIPVRSYACKWKRSFSTYCLWPCQISRFPVFTFCHHPVGR